ncbi:accessory gene regulator B family protein [Romboutsia sedimentorum]|uniref:accessory gene regulator ArgB-like protein n=1 Tax=Romboutsia sedimentorum TaxID=1368474 RepID=UPI0024DEF5E3|nr:accessory gene regulator B family protein [Romboutsia sedimentorum]MDK2587396.1 accessory gene regulator B family protein [Romboutsia sedimentorum]
MFKSLSYKFANILIKNNIIENEDLEIYRYGFETLIYFIVNISVVLFIGIIFDRLIHTIVFLSCYCTLRQFTGGYHAKNYIECTLTFAAIYLLTIFIDNNLDIERYKYLIILIYIFSIYIIYKLSPQEHRNKPLSEKEKVHYRSVAIKIISFISTIYMLSMLFDYLKEYTIYLFFAVIWICILLIIGLVKDFYCKKIDRYNNI